MRPFEVWFEDWLKVHLKLHRHVGLPVLASKDGQVEFRIWAKHFRALEVTETEATEASERLYGMPVHEARHFATLLELIRSARTAPRQGTSAEPPPWRRPDPEAAVRDQAARAAWEQLPEPRREELRRAVRDRFPELAGRAHFVEQMARAWNADPSSIPGPRPGPRERAEVAAVRPSPSWSTGKIEANIPSS